MGKYILRLNKSTRGIKLPEKGLVKVREKSNAPNFEKLENFLRKLENAGYPGVLKEFKDIKEIVISGDLELKKLRSEASDYPELNGLIDHLLEMNNKIKKELISLIKEMNNNKPFDVIKMKYFKLAIIRNEYIKRRSGLLSYLTNKKPVIKRMPSKSDNRRH